MSGRLNGGFGGRGARFLSPAAAAIRDKELAKKAACGGDDRFTETGHDQKTIESMITICNYQCTVKSLCESWASEQPAPVGFIVAAGRRYVAWTTCEICGKRCRGLPRCNQHKAVLIGLSEDEEAEQAG